MIRPTEIRLHQTSNILELCFEDGSHFELTCEFLRVHSPSAEVRGHGVGQEVLQSGKAGVKIDSIEPIGNYAVRLVFDDGHATGIYSWDLLHRFGSEQEVMWTRYLDKLKASGKHRDPEPNPVGESDD